jgi:hypothetical protein
MRAGTGAAAALLASRVAIPDRPATLCPLRALTGIPCPLCGATTAAVRLGHVDLIGALTANPFAIVGAIIVVLAPLAVAVRTVRRAAPPREHRVDGSRHRTVVALLVAVVAMAAELWQLVRFDVI